MLFLLATCACSQPRGQYGVTLKVLHGRLAVDRDAFTLTSTFRDPRQTKKMIREQVRAALSAIPIPSLSPLRGYGWPDYIDAYATWATEDPARLDLGSAFTSSFWFADILKTSPDFGLVLNEDQLDPAGGFVSFSILPPFEATRIRLDLTGLSQPRATKRQHELRKRLAHLNGMLWSSEAIRKSIQPFYANLGLSPEVILQPRIQSIQIIEGQRIASIVLPAGQVRSRDIDRVLWDILSTPDFHRAMRTKSAWESKRVLDFERELGYAEGDEPYAVAYRVEELQSLLSGLGYSAILEPDARSGPVPYVDLLIQKGGSQPARPFHLAAGFEYKPGQGVSVLGQGQISTLTAGVGGPSGDVWSGDYASDFLGFGALHQRLGASINSSSTVERQRFLAGEKVDQTGTSGSARMEWQPFRDLDGFLLLFDLTASHSVVSAGAIRNQALNTLEWAAQLAHRDKFQVQPRVLLGPNFGRATLTAHTHRRFDHWEYDLNGRFEDATRSTPLFEQPSFGGEDTVRGFRADDAVGRRLWSEQSEWWFPVPGLGNWNPRSPQLASIVQQLRLAPFFDAGGAYQTVASKPGLREGAGIGLRLDLRLAVLKLDWAYGFGDAATGGSRGKFYFNIGLTVPY